MKKLFLALALALSVASCAPGTAITPEKVAEAIAKVQQGVATACSAAGVFIPTAESVLLVLTQVSGANATVVAAASVLAAIDAIRTVACAPGVLTAPGPVTVNGKVIEFIVIK